MFIFHNHSHNAVDYFWFRDLLCRVLLDLLDHVAQQVLVVLM